MNKRPQRQEDNRQLRPEKAEDIQIRGEAFRMLHGDCAVINSQRLQTSSYSESSYLCCRVSASSGDAAEGMAPPRGRDCNFLKPSLVIT